MKHLKLTTLLTFIGFCMLFAATTFAQVYQPPVANEYIFPGGISGGQSLHSSNYLFQDVTLAAYDDGNDGKVIWQHINPGVSMICGGTVNYTGGYSHLEVGALHNSPTGAPYTAFVAYHLAGVGHAVDLYDWDPFACTFTYNTTHTLSTNPNPSRISMDCHIDYALAIGWTNAGTLNTAVYETGIFGPSFIHTITPTITPHNVDVAFTHGSQLWVHYVYNSLGTPQVEVSAEDFWVMRTAGAPTTYVPVYEDLNTLSAASAGNVFCSIDGADHGPDNWAYTYTEDHQNISIRIYDAVTPTAPTTFIVNDGSMGNTANNLSRNWAPVPAYNEVFDMINVGWITNNSKQSYIGVVLNWTGGLISNLDYLTIPNNPATASPTPTLAYSKMTEFSAPWLYAFFSELNGLGTHDFEHKYHDMTILSNFKTSGSHNIVCPDYKPGGHMAHRNEKMAVVELEVYPNPFNDQFTIDGSKLNFQGNVDVTIEDMSGKQVMQLSGSLKKVNASLQSKAGDLESGIYVLEVRSIEKDESHTWKIQKH